MNISIQEQLSQGVMRLAEQSSKIHDVTEQNFTLNFDETVEIQRANTEIIKESATLMGILSEQATAYYEGLKDES